MDETEMKDGDNLQLTFLDCLNQADKYMTSKSRNLSLASILDIFGTRPKKTELEFKPDDSKGDFLNTGGENNWKSHTSKYKYSLANLLQRARSEQNKSACGETTPKCEVINSETKTFECEDTSKCEANTPDNETDNSDTEFDNKVNNSKTEQSNSPDSSVDGNHSVCETNVLDNPTMESVERGGRTDLFDQSLRTSYNEIKYGGTNCDVSLPPIGLLLENGTINPERIDPDIKHKVSEGIARLSRKIRVDDRLKMEEWIGLEIQLERQMWKSKLQDAMKEIEKHRKTVVTTSAKIHDFNDALINTYPLPLPRSIHEENMSEYVKLHLVMNAITTELQQFIADKQECLNLMWCSQVDFSVKLSDVVKNMQENFQGRLEQASLAEEKMKEKISGLKRDLHVISKEYHTLSKTLEKRVPPRERTESDSSQESNIISQKRLKNATGDSNTLSIETEEDTPCNRTQPTNKQPEVSMVTFRLPTLENDSPARKGHMVKDRSAPKSLRTRHSSPSVSVNIRQCLRCKKPYRLQDNHKMACRYHTKSQVKADKLKSDGTLEYTHLLWECCAGDHESPPCCSGEHI